MSKCQKAVRFRIDTEKKHKQKIFSICLLLLTKIFFSKFFNIGLKNVYGMLKNMLNNSAYLSRIFLMVSSMISLTFLSFSIIF